MSDEHLSLRPFGIHAHAWVYEERGGLNVCAYGPSGESIQGRIPWRKVRQALKRKDRAKRRKERG